MTSINYFNHRVILLRSWSVNPQLQCRWMLRLILLHHMCYFQLLPRPGANEGQLWHYKDVLVLATVWFMRNVWIIDASVCPNRRIEVLTAAKEQRLWSRGKMWFSWSYCNCGFDLHIKLQFRERRKTKWMFCSFTPSHIETTWFYFFWSSDIPTWVSGESSSSVVLCFLCNKYANTNDLTVATIVYYLQYECAIWFYFF